MTPTWTDQAPIYQQLADRLASQLLDGNPPEGEALPSVRLLATQYLINPLTVSRALQSLADNGLVESRRGLGMYVRPGARQQSHEEGARSLAAAALVAAYEVAGRLEAEFLAGEEAVEDDRAGNAQLFFEQHAGLLENPLLAAGIEVQHDLARRKELG